MKSANLIVASGVSVQRTCGPSTILVTMSSGSFDLESSIQSALAAFLSLLTMSVASLSAAINALYSTGFLSRNFAEVHATVKECEPPMTSNELTTVWMPGCSNC